MKSAWILRSTLAIRSKKLTDDAITFPPFCSGYVTVRCLGGRAAPVFTNTKVKHRRPTSRSPGGGAHCTVSPKAPRPEHSAGLAPRSPFAAKRRRAGAPTGPADDQRSRALYGGE